MNTVLKIYSRIIVLIFPFFFLPVVYDGFGLGKNAFLIATGLIGLVLWLVDLLVNKKEVVKVNNFLGWFLLLAVWGMVSFFRLSLGAGMMALMGDTGFSLVLGLLIWLFLWLQINDKEEYKKQLMCLSISGIVVGLGSLLAFVIPNSKMPFLWPKDNPLVSINQGWSMTGSMLGEAILFLFLTVEWLKRLLKKLKEKVNLNEYFKEAIGVVFFGLLLFLSIYKTIKLGWFYLDNKSAWAIATEVLKNSPIFGIGLGNFVEAFLRFRPVSFNSTNLWSMTFNKSSMGILQIWTEMGLGGLILIFLAMRTWIKQKGKKYFWELGILGLLILLLPLNAIEIFLWVLLMANKSGEVTEKKMVLQLGEKRLNVMPYLVAVLILAGAGFVGFNLTKITLADFYWKQSVLAATKDKAVETYQLQIKTIGFNPNMADYRMIYSQTNLALASSLLSKKDLTDDEKQQASTLVQQSVREAKAAISLNGNISDYWANLAVIYKSLIGMVDGSADWSVQAYQQAILLNPSSVSLNMDLGGLYYAGGDFDSADRYFERSISNKNDYANSWYNWAYSAKQTKKLQAAVDRMTQALKFVPADSADYQKASEELVTWKKELDEATKQQAAAQAQQQQNQQQVQPETLKTPEALPTITEGNKVAVPSGTGEMAPPPMVTPTAIVTPGQ